MVLYVNRKLTSKFIPQRMNWTEKTNLIELSHNSSLPTLSQLTYAYYLNEEVDHVCVIALHRMHERTLATFNVLIRSKNTMAKFRRCRMARQRM